MNALPTPASLSELTEVVRSFEKVVPLGAGTKSRLSEVNVTKVSTLRLRGIVEYEPSEFTFTAMAGTPLREVADTLAARGQYLPFDAMLVNAGATLGGTVAAGLSGPGRLRFGGLRDFILGVQFVDGLGRVLRMGGKVVKNAAGFDLPKFFVGSLGRFGVLASLTFKVFPSPASRLTLKISAGDIESAERILVEAARARWEAEALDIPPGGLDLLLRLAGPAAALREMAKEILTRWRGEKLIQEEAEKIWSELREFRWAYAEGPLVKIVVTPSSLMALHSALQSLEAVRVHVSSGGNMAFVSLPSTDQTPALSRLIRDLSLSGITLRGPGPLWYGAASRPKCMQAVKHALDPVNRFPGLDE